MEVMAHLLESDLYNEEEFFWAHYCQALFLLRGAHALAKGASDDCDCENCSDISDLLDEYFEVMASATETSRKHKRRPATTITLDAMRDRLIPGQTIIVYDTMEKLRFRVVEELPKKDNGQDKLPGNAKRHVKAA